MLSDGNRKWLRRMRIRVQMFLGVLTFVQLLAAVSAQRVAAQPAPVSSPSAAEIGMEYDIRYLKERVQEFDRMNLPGVIARFEVYERTQQTTYTLIWGAFITGGIQLAFQFVSAVKKRV